MAQVSSTNEASSMATREETSSPQPAAKSLTANCNSKEQLEAANNNNISTNNNNNININDSNNATDNVDSADQQSADSTSKAPNSNSNGTGSSHSSGADSSRLGGEHTVIECAGNAQVTSTSSNSLAQVQQLECSGQELKFVTKFGTSKVDGELKTNKQIANKKKEARGQSAAERDLPFCPAEAKHQRLSCLQALLLRKWPCLAISICIISSLMFGILLSALTVYLMHGASECSLLAARVAAVSGSHSPLLARGDLSSISALELADASLLSLTGESQILDAPGQVSSAATSAPQSSQKTQFQRLPGTLWPVHYDLFVWPHIAEPDFNFSGQVSIRIKCQEATDNITLHSLDLNIDTKSVQLKRIEFNGTAHLPKVRALNQEKQLQYFIVQLDGQLEPGAEYALEMDFSGQLNDDLAGFYKIKYEQKNSTEPTWIAATQFQATDARRAFPCFDEPLYKATFNIKIKHWRNMTALSNMPIVDQQVSEDKLWVTDTFAKSHRMSTYLVAYAVTNFQSRSKGNISVWTRPGFTHTAEYALEIAGKILSYYEKFFGIEYPLPKMDMIALPDFNAGAMENWGLITYRETAMLYDETSSSVANKQRVAVVVAHELAHQWFGNLVTPKWWDDLWLNEGFASYVEYIGVDHVEPTWRMLDQFVVEEVQDVFKVDGLSSSHQISIPVNNPDEISEIFDHISYAKGASIIRMMNHFLTELVFKSGLRSYLQALRYSNAEQSDLWAHLTRAQQQSNVTSNSQLVDVGQVMNSWTLQTGYPLVTLNRNYGDSARQVRAKISQARYQPYKRDQPQQVNQTEPMQRWEIPITFTWKSEQNWRPLTRLWLHQNQSQPVELNSNELDLPKSDDEWWLLNVQQVGYYRVNYDRRNWRLLIDQLNQDHSKISMTNRAQILDDIFELARSAVIDYRFAMEATRYLKFERDYLPWDTVLMSFAYIDEMLQRTPIYGDWEAYLGELIAPYYSRYKDSDWMIANSSSNALVAKDRQPVASGILDPNDILEQYNQVNAIAWACTVDKHCIQKARSMFQQWRITGKNLINPALRYTTYCTSIKNGDKADWEFLWRAYEKEQNASERDRIMRALGCSREIWILARYLEWTFSKTKPIRRQDGAFVFRMIAKNNYGRDIAFNFMRERWSTIKDYYGKTSFSLGSLIRSVSTSMNTQIELQQLLNFYESIKGDVGTGKRSFQIAIEEVESNVAWRNRNYKIIEDWLQSEQASKAKRTAS